LRNKKTKKTQKYRQSGHLVDEKLKYSKPSHTETLFDLISQDTKEKIEESKIEVKAEESNSLLLKIKSFMHSTGYYTRTAKQITQKLMILQWKCTISTRSLWTKPRTESRCFKIQAVRALQSLYGKR